ncbi:alpha/beta hydrolase [Streptomyces xanthii]|uniref:Alpha/beta hydrolase n=1 Tax=Streptomyces xanthii TaxID=2768069 RepID=A0A7H1B115_9ACTN|nr:alpha/beta hydrolase [Streptomyces xanthii]QNS02420.1 alpha/beta hydrolase [Streptomyces xanthii]
MTNAYGEEIPAPGEGSLHLLRAGTGSPVVLLHGAGMDARLWDAVAPELARHHHVIRYDARGLGRSTPPTTWFSDVTDLSAVLDHCGVERAALVGLSMGGETALDFTLTHPDRVTSLALVASSLGGHIWPDTPDTAAYGAARRSGDAAELAALELSVWAALGREAPGGALIERMVTENAERRLVSEAWLTGTPGHDAASRLAEIDAPALVLHGTHDHPEIAVIADRLTKGIRDAHGETLRAADHYLPLRVPARLAALLLAHLAGPPEGQPGHRR